MSKLLVIIGVTGQQGSSVANKVLEDPELSKQYSIRGTTRDPSKPEAKALEAKGVEIVKGDVDNRASMKAALAGAHTVFAMTVSIYTPGGDDQELAQGKAIAEEAVAAGVQLLIFSIVPSPKKISNGKYSIPIFDAKDVLKDYIETLPIKSAFFAPGSFMQNFDSVMAPAPLPDGTLAYTNFVRPETTLPCIDIVADTGKFVGAILADPAKYSGKTFNSATRLYTISEIVEIMSKTSGKSIKYNQMSKEAFGAVLPESSRDFLLTMFSYYEECGYYGPESKELVNWAATNARGEPSSLEDYFKRNPLKV